MDIDLVSYGVHEHEAHRCGPCDLFVADLHEGGSQGRNVSESDNEIEVVVLAQFALQQGIDPPAPVEPDGHTGYFQCADEACDLRRGIGATKT